MILSCSSIEKSFGETGVLHQVSFHVNENEKVAIVGINGAGKSTLLKILAGELEADAGQVSISRDTVVGYLPQHPDLFSDKTIYDEVLEGKRDLIDLEARLIAMEEELGRLQGRDLDAAAESYQALLDDFTRQNGSALKSEARGVLKGLGFGEEDFDKPCRTLSGGQKTRVALAKMLLSHPDLLLLDEPTNHLDMDSIRWLENYLLSYQGAVIIVAHDRYFLDRVVSKVIGISRHRAELYIGNYTAYAKKAAERRAAEYKAWQNQQREIRHQQQVIDKLKQFNREKSIKRAESREKQLEKMELLDKPMEEKAAMRLTITPSVTSGRDVLDVEGLSKSFGSNRLFADLSFSIKRGDRVALIGANGTGKTTILKILNDRIPADAGFFRLGTNVKIGYYDQEQQDLTMDKSVLDEIWDDYPSLNETAIRSTLAAFLFTGDMVYRRIDELSGGERGRVALAKLMLSDSNFLILDEPTNHLDMESREILEDALNSYEGTVFFVSHDRYFINRTATRILHLDGHMLTDFEGNYDYYLEKCREAEAGGTALTKTGTAPDPNDTPASVSRNKSAAEAANPAGAAGKVDWKEQKARQAEIRKKENRIRDLEASIMEAEEEIEAIEAQYLLPEIATNSAKLNELAAKQEALKEQLAAWYDEWESVSEALDGC